MGGVPLHTEPHNVTQMYWAGPSLRKQANYFLKYLLNKWIQRWGYRPLQGVPRWIWRGSVNKRKKYFRYTQLHLFFVDACQRAVYWIILLLQALKNDIWYIIQDWSWWVTSGHCFILKSHKSQDQLLQIIWTISAESLPGLGGLLCKYNRLQITTYPI